MLSEAKHPACLRQSAGFFVAALLRMTGGATAASRYKRARLAARKARKSCGARLYYREPYQISYTRRLCGSAELSYDATVLRSPSHSLTAVS